ncbi:acyltransferase [Pseudoalteromonas sp. S201]|uniref:acyltransferase n=1 Tax=Pseudoalteromonas sp. S201 TaxID=579519 RepID=UPI00110CE361|nr:acyltransferase [Pseudoalteromonas sp. S201]TMS92564.1 acyltransferase [Pseudoalteromonas sp. S201]
MTFTLFKRIQNFIYRHVFKLFFSKSFKFFGKKVCLISPDRLEGTEFISIGDNTTISTCCWLLALKNDMLNPLISIKSNCQLGRFVHIVATREVVIECNVLIADKVYISDNLHGYKNINEPILKQKIEFVGKTSIGEGSWIAENVVIVGAVIGKNCVVGANSVVRGDFPDYCVIVGAPARVVKRYNPETSSWEKTDTKGRFL